jgi:sugar phosphate isomerase/epimerase
MGYISLASGQVNERPWSAMDLLQKAGDLGLGGIEVPLAAKVPSFEGRIVELPPVSDDLAGVLRDRQLALIADFGILIDHSADELIQYVRRAHLLGARVVRAIISNLLCGDRRPLSEGWAQRLRATARRLSEVLPVAEDLGICIAVENHQDASVDDLLDLAEMVHHSSAFGVTLDTGNPLATGEDPVEACRRLAPIIRHVHLKDYTIHFAPDGYRLVRCAAGEGVVDFPAILRILSEHGHPLRPGIEIAAQSARTIPILDPSWWTTYPARDARQLLPVLRLLWGRGVPADVPFATVWESAGESRAVLADEWKLVQQSAAYFAQHDV